MVSSAGWCFKGLAVICLLADYLTHLQLSGLYAASHMRTSNCVTRSEFVTTCKTSHHDGNSLLFSYCLNHFVKVSILNNLIYFFHFCFYVADWASVTRRCGHSRTLPLDSLDQQHFLTCICHHQWYQAEWTMRTQVINCRITSSMSRSGRLTNHSEKWPLFPLFCIAIFVIQS